MKLLIKTTPNSAREAEAIDLAVQCVGKAQDESLTHLLIEYLMGDHDGMPKVSSCSNLLKTVHSVVDSHTITTLFLGCKIFIQTISQLEKIPRSI